MVVRVKNELLDQGVTVHWHGLPQRANPWMDGVPDVTQCVIPVGRTFTYRFTATPAGSFWYHSHVGYQRFEGLAGILINILYTFAVSVAPSLTRNINCS